MNREFKDVWRILRSSAIKDEYGLKECLKSDIRVVFFYMEISVILQIS